MNTKLNMNEFGIPYGKALTNSQLEAEIEPSMQSKSQSLHPFSEQIRSKRNSDRNRNFGTSAGND
jgi:hypothetical protein